MAEISLHPAIEVDYEDALAWYLHRSPAAASGLSAEFARTLASIKRFPELYPRYDDRHRFAVLRRYPFCVIYRVDRDQIRIIALAHASRSSIFWEGRS